MILKLVDLSLIQKLFVALEDKDGFLDVMNVLEELVPVLETFTSLSDLELDRMSSDDATTEAALRARDAAGVFFALADRLVTEYMELSDSELRELVEVSEAFALQVAIVYFGNAGYAQVMNELSAGGQISTNHSVELLDKLATRKSDVEVEVLLIMRLFEKYKPFFAEYVLTDEQLGAIEGALTDGVNFALLDPSVVRRIISDENC